MRARNVLVAAAVALAAAGAAWGSGAVGAIVGADGTINGCYAKETGLLRAVAGGRRVPPERARAAVVAAGAEGGPGATGEPRPGRAAGAPRREG